MNKNKVLSVSPAFIWGSLSFLIVFIGIITFYLPAPWLLVVLAICFGSVALIFLLQYPELMVYLLIIFVPVEEFLEKWIPRGVFYEGVRFGGEVVLIFFMGVVLLSKTKPNAHWYKTPIDMPLLVFLLVFLTSAVVNATSPLAALLGVRPLVRYILVFYILIQLRVTKQFFEKTFFLTVFMASLVSVIGLMQTVIGERLTNFLLPGDVVVGGVAARSGIRHLISSRTYIFSTMGRYDTLGVFLMFVLLIAIGGYMGGGRKQKRRIIPFFLVGFPALILTFSRQSWVGLVLGIGVMTLISRWKDLQRVRFVYMLSLIIIPIVVLLAIPYAQYFGTAGSVDASVIERMLEPLSQRYFEVSRYSYGRLFVIFDVGTRLLNKAPLVGFGPGQFGSLTARFFNVPYWEFVNIPENSAHFINDVNWIVILGQFGVLGTLSFLWMFFNLFFASRKRYLMMPKGVAKGIILAYSASIIIYILIGFLGPNFEVRQISFYMWLWGGLIMGMTVKKT